MLPETDGAIKIALLPDPVKLEHEGGYPPPAIRERISETAMTLEQISCAELLSGCLLERGFNVLCVPGGFAPHTVAKLGDDGKRLVRQFVHNGGGFVGVCAGAFVGIAFELLPLDYRDVDHEGRDESPCRLAFTSLGQQLLGASSGEVTVRYANGPLFRIHPSSDDAEPSVFTLATFETDLRGGGVWMQGSSAVVYGRHGCGAVALASPHLEDGVDERTRTPFRNLCRIAHTPACVERM